MAAFMTFGTVRRGNVDSSEKQHYFPDCQLTVVILELVELVYRGNDGAKTDMRTENSSS